MIFRAGIPMESIVSEALKHRSNCAGMHWIIKNPMNIMDTAAIILSLMVFTIRFGLRAPKFYATIGTNPLFNPNTGMKTKLCSLK